MDAPPERYPELAAYLARLPVGIASHPHCRAKCSLLRGLLDECEPVRRLEDAPPELERLLLSPPPPSAWVPEVLYVAAHFALLDVEGVSVEEMLQRTYRANKKLTESRMYRALARVASPSILLRGAGMSWGLIHQGVKLGVDVERRGAQITLSHPAHLYPRLAHRSAALGFLAVLEAANAESPSAEVVKSGPDGAIVRATWH